MKFATFLLAGALATGLHAAECSYEPPVRESGSAGFSFGYPAAALYLFEGDYLDLSKMDKREPAVKNASGTDTVWMYRSALDSTMIVIVSEKVVKVARVAYSDNQDDFVDSLFAIKHDAVFKDEFPRLQKAGVFKGTAEQADSLVNHVFELCKKFYAREFGYTGCEFNPPESRRRNDGKDIDMVDMPLAFLAVAGIHTPLLDTLNFCPDYRFAPESTTASPAVPGLTQARFSFKKLSQNRYQIAGVRPNAPYKAFSLNGQLIESGILNNGVFTAKKLPVILMLNEGRSIYLKD
jgi:hypothetical protein